MLNKLLISKFIYFYYYYVISSSDTSFFINTSIFQKVERCKNLDRSCSGGKNSTESSTVGKRIKNT